MLKSSVIIPTYNRPKELEDCLDSILKQTVLPYEVIIVDDGNLKDRPLEKQFQNKGIKYIYYKKDIPDLTRSRNKGVALSSGDIIFFLDDDVVLFPDYIEQILAAYSEGTVGVGGLVKNNIRKLSLIKQIRRLYEIIFLISGLEEGKVLASGFCTDYGLTGNPPGEIKTVDFLSGGVMSYRREVFSEFGFRENYRKYGSGEDKDFSYRVSRKYEIKINPKARLYHLEEAPMKPDEMEFSRMVIVGRFMFFSDYLQKRWWSWFFFGYSLFGYTLEKIISLIIFPRKKTLAQLKGIFKALRDIVNGNILANE